MTTTKSAFVLIFSILYFSGKAQKVASSQGGDYSDNNTHLSFTIGEMLIESYASTDLMLTQGFHQPLLVQEVVAGIRNSELDLPVSIYPNPVFSSLKLEIDNYSGLQYHLIDLNGKSLIKASITKRLTTIDVSELNIGIYQLFLIDPKTGKSKRYSIIKK